MSIRLAAIVITYYPDNDVLDNIKRYIDDVDYLMIWENTPEPDRYKYRFLVEGADILGTGKNEGIAYPLNRAIRRARAKGYTHLLSMDQDSYWINFKEYRKAVETLSSRQEIGIFSPNINGLNKSKSVMRVNQGITSGSVYALQMFSLIGLFREDYFIDGVDFEMCYRARSFGFLLLKICSCNLQQNFGTKSRSILGCPITNYTPFRTYYIIRNSLFLWREYRKMFNGKKFLLIHALVIRCITILLDEKEKLSKYKALLRGLMKGFFTRNKGYFKYPLID